MKLRFIFLIFFYLSCVAYPFSFAGEEAKATELSSKEILLNTLKSYKELAFYSDKLIVEGTKNKEKQKFQITILFAEPNQLCITANIPKVPEMRLIADGEFLWIQDIKSNSFIKHTGPKTRDALWPYIMERTVAKITLATYLIFNSDFGAKLKNICAQSVNLEEEGVQLKAGENIIVGNKTIKAYHILLEPIRQLKQVFAQYADAGLTAQVKRELWIGEKDFLIYQEILTEISPDKPATVIISHFNLEKDAKIVSAHFKPPANASIKDRIKEIAPLAEKLKSDDLSVRVKAVKDLSALDDLETIEIIVRALDDPAEEMYAAAYGAIKKTGKPAIPYLLKHLKHGKEKGRAGIILGEMDKSSAPFLIDCLMDNDPDVRWNALCAIKKLTGQDYGFDIYKVNSSQSKQALEKYKSIIDK